jgi:hypothetical protein
MLERRPRRPTITEPEDIIEQIARPDLPVFEPIVVFQAQYGGIEYVVHGDPTTGSSCDLFDGFDPNEQ